MVSLPIALLSLVPSGTVEPAASTTAIRVVTALFPFKPALQAITAALDSGGPDIGGPLLHLAILIAAYGAPRAPRPAPLRRRLSHSRVGSRHAGSLHRRRGRQPRPPRPRGRHAGAARAPPARRGDRQRQNTAGGVGITEKTANALFEIGTDVITTGNHVYRHREVYDYLDRSDRVIRPANYPQGNPGRGHIVIEAGGRRVGVINLSGAVGLKVARLPFHTVDMILEQIEADCVVVDFHAEVTSEKVAMGWHLDGRVAAVDTTGAGDSFNGAYLAARLAGVAAAGNGRAQGACRGGGRGPGARRAGAVRDAADGVHPFLNRYSVVWR